MTKTLQVLALSTLLIGSASAAQAQVTFGIRIGRPPVERASRVPPQPGPEFVWVDGYWYNQGGRYQWLNGYWTRPPYEGAYWVAPYYTGGQYFAGQWEGNRGNVAHDRSWDRSKQRDERRGPGASDHNNNNNNNNNNNGRR